MNLVPIISAQTIIQVIKVVHGIHYSNVSFKFLLTGYKTCRYVSCNSHQIKITSSSLFLSFQHWKKIQGIFFLFIVDIHCVVEFIFSLFKSSHFQLSVLSAFLLPFRDFKQELDQVTQ